MDYGDEGPYTTGPYEGPDPHWVYIALKPLPPQTDHERRMADFVKSFQAPMAASARADASAHAAASAQAEAPGPWANAAEGAREIAESEIATWLRMSDEEYNERTMRQNNGEEEERLYRDGEEEEPVSVEF